MNVVQQQQIDRASLRKLNPVSSGHTSIVYVTKRGQYVLGAGRLTMGEIWLNTPKELYSVDIAPHQDTFTLLLPSKEQAFSFTAEVRVTWRIVDPVAAVRVKLADPVPAVQHHVEERLRELARGFDVENAVDAERQINLDYGDRVMSVDDAVQVQRCKVVLKLDEDARVHIASRTEHLRAMEAAEREREIARERRVLAQDEEEHELRMKTKRMSVYANALREDDQNVLALMLAGHGEDATAVINLMMQQKQLQFDAARDMLDKLLNANLVNRRDVASIMNNAGAAIVSGVQGPKPLLAAPEPHDEEDDE
ncbi:hypothetical protein PV646_43945 [Streptomyces sp. ID05-26A]|nr:hypothetical protein [Streptomyces sp. ID05-26A]